VVIVLGGRRGATTLAQRLTRTPLRPLITATPASPRLNQVA
jgi:hypothetical protein